MTCIFDIIFYNFLFLYFLYTFGGCHLVKNILHTNTVGAA
jgi:hypothetical protein